MLKKSEQKIDFFNLPFFPLAKCCMTVRLMLVLIVFFSENAPDLLGSNVRPAKGDFVQKN